MPSQLARAQEKLRGLPKNKERRRMITRMTTGHRPIIEDLPQLDIRELQCKGLLEEGEPRRSGPYEGDFYLESNIYQVKIFPPGRPPQIISIHQKTQWGFAGGRSMCLQFKCPTCPPPTPKRTGYCGKLRDLGDLFRCKTCAVEAGAVYHSQTLSPENRKRHKAEKIKKRLGWHPGDAQLYRPNGARHKTYQRMCHQLRELGDTTPQSQSRRPKQQQSKQRYRWD